MAFLRVSPFRFAILTTAVLGAMTLAGCKKTPTKKPGQNTSSASNQQANNSSSQAPVKGKFNVAFVYVGPVGDGGWTYAHDQGRKYLEKHVPHVHTAYFEKVTEGAEAEQIIRNLARKGFNLIVTTSFGYMDATQTVASEFPNVKFLHISGFKHNSANFGNAFGAMEDMKYLAGMIAGARAKADGHPKLGYIAPFPIPEVIRFGNAFMLGAKTTCPTCTTQIRWTGSWFDPGKEQEAAESMLNAGVDVIATGADTTGPIVVAGKKGKWAIGYDSRNACDADKAHCLTAPYWNWGVVYARVAKQVRAGTWKPTSWYGGPGTGVVDLVGFEEHAKPATGVPKDVIPLVKAKLADMKSGKFTRFDIFAGPIEDNKGNVVVKKGEKLTQADLEGLKGCKTCMSWLAKGIIGEIPAKKK